MTLCSEEDLYRIRSDSKMMTRITREVELQSHSLFTYGANAQVGMV